MPSLFEDDDGEENDEPILLGGPPPARDENLGPDKHDADLMDGSWEAKYYAGRTRSRDWSAIMTGLGLLVLLGLLLPVLLVFFR